MAVEELDPVSGHVTTGHEWNGIKELDTPVPRGVLIFLIVTHLFAVIWWFVMPTWPLGTSYTKGLLGTDQRKIVEEKLVQADAARAPWVNAIEKSTIYIIALIYQGIKKHNPPKKTIFYKNVDVSRWLHILKNKKEFFLDQSVF